MAVTKQKTENNGKEELGYIKAFLPDYENPGDDSKKLYIEFIQTKIEDCPEATTIICKDKETKSKWKEIKKNLSVSPGYNGYDAIAEILEEELFYIVELRPFIYPTHDKEGHRIFY